MKETVGAVCAVHTYVHTARDVPSTRDPMLPKDGAQIWHLCLPAALDLSKLAISALVPQQGVALFLLFFYCLWFLAIAHLFFFYLAILYSFWNCSLPASSISPSSEVSFSRLSALRKTWVSASQNAAFRQAVNCPLFGPSKDFSNQRVLSTYKDVIFCCLHERWVMGNGLQIKW